MKQFKNSDMLSERVSCVAGLKIRLFLEKQFFYRIMAVEGVSFLKKKRKVSGWFVFLIILLVISVIVSIIFPWFFDNYMLGKASTSNIDIKEWPGFMSNYAGGILGGVLGSVATILGVYLTIKQQQDQVVEERRLSVRPALYFSELQEGEKDNVTSWTLQKINVAKTTNTRTEECTLCFKTENLGPGNIIKIRLNMSGADMDDGAEGSAYSLTKCGEIRYWKYGFIVTYDSDNKFFNYPLTLNFYYTDVFGNVYIQMAHATVQKNYTEENDIEVDSPVIAWLSGEITEPKLAKIIPQYMRGWQS